MGQSVGVEFVKLLLCGLLTSSCSHYHPHGEEVGHQIQLCHNYHTHNTAGAGGHTGTWKLLSSQQAQSQEKTRKNNYCPHSEPQYLCLTNPRLNPHDQPL